MQRVRLVSSGGLSGVLLKINNILYGVPGTINNLLRIVETEKASTLVVSIPSPHLRSLVGVLEDKLRVYAPPALRVPGIVRVFETLDVNSGAKVIPITDSCLALLVNEHKGNVLIAYCFFNDLFYMYLKGVLDPVKASRVIVGSPDARREELEILSKRLRLLYNVNVLTLEDLAGHK